MDAADKVRELAAANGVEPTLPEACEAEAAAWVADPGLDDPALEDLTGLPFVTIDNPDSRDLDQALFVEASGKGHVVWYALADASYYVRPGSALFAEALRRGATYYLPGLVAPMLPLSLCEGLISLNPEVERRATVFRVELDGRGRRVAGRVHRARVLSRAKLSYEGVQAWLDGGDAPCADPAALASLRALVEVGERRMREAETRDVVRYRREEVRVRIGEQGMDFVAQGSARNDVERYNEQVSLLVNIEGARRMKEAGGEQDLHAIFRTHDPPHAQMLRGFADLVAALCAAHDLPTADWGWRPGGAESLAAYVRRLPVGSGPHQGVARAIQRQALRTSGRSGFGVDPGRHFGVGAEVYSRFTAPMREVVGIFLHKELWELEGAVQPRPAAEDEATREAVLEATRRARSLQRKLDRECDRFVLDAFFADATGPLGATVMGLGRRKVHLRLDAPPLDAKAYAHDLEAQHGTRLRIDADAAQGTREDGTVFLRVGQRAVVRVLGFDEARDRWRLGVEPQL